MQRTVKAERRAILLSVWGNLVAALLGLFFAFLTNSEAVLIDGVYSLINFSVARPETLQLLGSRPTT